MRFRNSIMIAVVLFAGMTVLQARPKENKVEGWSEPFSQWSHDQAMDLLKDSPWAKSQNLTTIINTRTAGVMGEKDFYYTYRARFFSALPIREGYVRLYQLLNNYSSKNAIEKQQFDDKFKKALDLDVSNRVIVAFEFDTNDPQAARDMLNFLHTTTKDTFKLNTYLVSDRLGRVDLVEYYPPSTDGTGAKFIFPRIFNGKPVILPEDKNVRLDFHFPSSVFSRGGLSATPNPDGPGADSVSASNAAGHAAAPLTSAGGGGATGSISDVVSEPSVSTSAVEQHLLITFDVDKMYFKGQLSY